MQTPQAVRSKREHYLACAIRRERGAKWLTDPRALDPEIPGTGLAASHTASGEDHRTRNRIRAACLLIVAVAGLATVVFARHPAAALIGFALTGLGCSSVYPLAISAAAGCTEDRPRSMWHRWVRPHLLYSHRSAVTRLSSRASRNSVFLCGRSASDHCRAVLHEGAGASSDYNHRAWSRRGLNALSP
jgi:hypothetical protein